MSQHNNQSSTYLDHLSQLLQTLDRSEIDDCVNTITSYVNSDNHIFTCGNGGSATTASHYVTDWAKMTFLRTDRTLRTTCLSDNIGLVTAYANDIDYGSIFAEQLKYSAKCNDLLIVVSGSGNSTNIINALVQAKNMGMRTLGVVGFNGGKAKELCDHYFHVNSSDMQLCEDVHLIFGHIVMKALIK